MSMASAAKFRGISAQDVKRKVPQQALDKTHGDSDIEGNKVCSDVYIEGSKVRRERHQKPRQ
jgi:hypothetical protein